MITLSNRFLHFSLDISGSQWSLQPCEAGAPRIVGARLGAAYRRAHARQRGLVAWEGDLEAAQAAEPAEVDSVHGRLRQMAIRARTTPRAAGPLALMITFGLPDAHPCLLWRVTVTNAGSEPLRLQAVDLLRLGPPRPMGGRHWAPGARRAGQMPAAGGGRLHWGREDGRLAFFSNGYQSWSFAGALQAEMRQPASIFGPLGDPKALNLLTPRFRQPGRFTSDMYGVLGHRDAGLGLVAGFLAQREQFSFVEVHLDGDATALRLTAQFDGVVLRPGESRFTDWAYLQFIDLHGPDPLGEYAGAVARENGARVPAHTPVGWCSWYQYFDKVTEHDMLDNLEAIGQERERLPLDFVQLDDGYQAQVGDWFETKPTFPRGLAWLADEIRARGQTPGLWLAPYIVRSDARLLRERPHWFLRQPNGRLVNAGFNWMRWCYALDPTHPEVRAHVRKLIQTAVREWGFPYLKLDFLYAAALPGQRYDASLTRAQAMRLALTDIREAAGSEVFLLGCGCPLGSAVGLVDGMRIGTDVAPDWDPHLFTPHIAPLLRRETDFIGVRNAIRNIINRAPLHGRWWLNDPDCLLVREHDTRLTEAEVRSLASAIALSGGMFLVSDNMRRLPPERQRYIAALLPVLGRSAYAPGWMDSLMPDLFVLPLRGAAGEWVVAGVFNWQNVPADRVVPLSHLGLDGEHEHVAAEFWEQQHWPLAPGQPLTFPAIPPHGVRLVAVRRRSPGPALVGSSFHFSQGAEVVGWHTRDCELQLALDLGRVAEGELRLALPAAPRQALADSQPLPASALGQGVYSVRLQVNRTATLTVNW